jgi:hypothetical protein
MAVSLPGLQCVSTTSITALGGSTPAPAFVLRFVDGFGSPMIGTRART